MVRKKLGFGNIDHILPCCDKEWVSKIMGQTRTRPRFVSEIDEKRWARMWAKEAEKLGIIYVHGQNRFDEKSGGEYLEGRELDFCDEKMSGVLRRYDAVASMYNERRAEPAERESSSSLYGFLVEVDRKLSA